MGLDCLDMNSVAGASGRGLLFCVVASDGDAELSRALASSLGVLLFWEMLCLRSRKVRFGLLAFK